MIEEHIVSFTEGRIRLRHSALRNAALGAEISAFIRSMNGIESVEHKALTGSLLIHYDETIITEEEIHTLLEQGEGWLNANAPQQEAVAQSVSEKKECCSFVSMPCGLTQAQKRKIFYRGMTATFVATLLTGGVGNKQAHYIAGGAFAALTLAHLWRMRRAI